MMELFQTVNASAVVTFALTGMVILFIRDRRAERNAYGILWSAFAVTAVTEMVIGMDLMELALYSACMYFMAENTIKLYKK